MGIPLVKDVIKLFATTHAVKIIAACVFIKIFFNFFNKSLYYIIIICYNAKDMMGRIFSHHKLLKTPSEEQI